MTDKNLLVIIELEALVSEREGMIAMNQQRLGLGYSVAYDDAAFFKNAEDMRALREKVTP